MKSGTRAEVGIDIDASPETVYDVVSDVRRMGEWSPECQRCEWIGGASGPAVGARFKGTNRRGLVRWSTKSRVVVADRGREFVFLTGHVGRDMTRWSYRFESTSTHTRVVESFEMCSDMPWYFRLADRLLMGVKDRKIDLEANIGETLRRLKIATENRHVAS